MTKYQNKFFSGLPIYFANLDRSPERYQRLLNDFEEYGITEYSRVSAIDGLSLEQPPSILFAEHQTRDFLLRPPYGHFSIFVTYLKMMQEFLETDYEYALFCDDDIDFYNSTKMNFNFYDTLKYHNPEFYNVRVSIMKLDYYDTKPLVAGKLQRPEYLVVGQASIFNRKWVERFIKKYNPNGQKPDKNFVLDITSHKPSFCTITPEVVAIDIAIEDEYALSLPLFKHLVFDESLCEPQFKGQNMAAITDKHNDMISVLDSKKEISIEAFIRLDENEGFSNNAMENKFFKGLPIWFINLDSSTDRRDNMLNSFKKYGITEYRRISAIDGSENNLEIPAAIYHTKTLTSGEMAANLSYIKLMNEFINSDNEYILMCDDDVDFKNSTMLNFNFYETLKYHNPEKYSLKLNALDISYWFNETNNVLPNRLIKPLSLSFGNATIINKNWAINFLKKYNVLNKKTEEIHKSFIYKYTENFGNLNSFVIPACDAITFDEHTYVWKIFGVFDFRSTLNPAYFTDKDMMIQQQKLLLSYNKDIVAYDWKNLSSVDIFKEIVSV